MVTKAIPRKKKFSAKPREAVPRLTKPKIPKLRSVALDKVGYNEPRHKTYLEELEIYVQAVFDLCSGKIKKNTENLF